MAVSKRVRFEVLRRDGHRCRYCGAAAENGALLTVDHVLPVVLGGTNDLLGQAFIDQWAIIAEAVDIAMAARISGYKVFRYCVGIVNRRKDEVLKRAMEEFAQNVGGR